MSGTVAARTLRILFVDDDEVMGMLFRMTMQRLGHHVDGFTDPADAIAAYARAPDGYDLVVSDVRLGESSAFEMCTHIRAANPRARILLTSGLVRDEDRERARAMAIPEVLPKSQAMTRLPELIGRLFPEPA